MASGPCFSLLLLLRTLDYPRPCLSTSRLLDPLPSPFLLDLRMCSSFDLSRSRHGGGSKVSISISTWWRLSLSTSRLSFSLQLLHGSALINYSTAITTTTTATAAVFGERGASAVVASSLDDLVHPQHYPVSATDETLCPETQVFEFCEADLFPETLQNSEITSRSNCYDENFSYAANLSFPSDLADEYSSGPIEANKLQSSPNEIVNDSATTNRSTIDTAIAAATINNNNTLSIIYDSQDDLDNTLSASIDFCTSPAYPEASYLTLSHQDQMNFSSVEPQVQVTDNALNGLSVSKYPADPLIPFMAPTLSSVYEDDCLSMMPPFLRLNPSVSSPYSFLDPFTESFLPGTLSSTLTADNSAILTKPILAGSELQSKELDYLGNDGGKFCPDQLQQIYNSRDIQSLSHDNQQLGSGDVSTHLSTEISALEDSTFKVAKLSVEQRKEKIHRYIKKRNERNFSKKIKYACRKTLADSRPRVRGRFARNDDFGDTTHRHTGGHPEEYYYDEASVKEEEDLVNPSNIFAHISGVNSFRCGYPIQSWI